MVPCLALLLDFEWEIPRKDRWISLDLCPWTIDYSDQNLEGMLKEVASICNYLLSIRPRLATIGRSQT